MKLLVSIALIFISFILSAQPQINGIYPPHWWVGLQQNNLQILLNGQGIADWNISLKENKTATIESVRKLENSNYLIIDVAIKTNEPIVLDFKLNKGNSSSNLSYELKSRKPGSNLRDGINNADFIYQIAVDRFANGNPNNDNAPEMAEPKVDRNKDESRHGGDLQGIIEKLNYLDNLGVSCLWLDPILENNQANKSSLEHAPTNHYTVDKRLGSNQLYQNLISESHKKGIKIINDLVLNQVGSNHFLALDPPAANWLLNANNNTNNIKPTVLLDPYATKSDLQKFHSIHPNSYRLNQSNQLVSKYLLQKCIWWIEEFDLDAYHISNYALNEQNFIEYLNSNIKKEYPNFSIIANVPLSTTAEQSYFSSSLNSSNPNLPSICDYPLQSAILSVLTADTKNNLYHTLSQDYLYKNAYSNITFYNSLLSDRLIKITDGNIDKVKMAIAAIMTLRGIPCLLYGSEILLNGNTNLAEFTGGWQGDALNKFDKKDRTNDENDLLNFISTLANYRFENASLQKGELKQFVPQNGIYVYLRASNTQKVLVIMNTNNTAQKFNSEYYNTTFDKALKAKEISTDKNYDLTKSIKLKAFETLVFELK